MLGYRDGEIKGVGLVCGKSETGRGEMVKDVEEGEEIRSANVANSLQMKAVGVMGLGTDVKGVPLLHHTIFYDAACSCCQTSHHHRNGESNTHTCGHKHAWL